MCRVQHLEGKMAVSSGVKWLVTLLLPLLIYFAAPSGGLVAPQFPMFLALSAMAILAWAFNVLSAITVAGGLTFLFILLGVAPGSVVFKSWSTVLPWLSFAALIIGEGMDKSGLARRMALYCLRWTGGSFAGLMIGFGLGGLALVVVIPNVLARLVVLCTIAVGIAQTLKIDAKSRMSSALIMLAFCGAAGPQCLFLTSSESFIWAFDMMQESIGMKMSFWEYARQATFINVIYHLITLGIVWIVKGRTPLIAGNEVREFIESNIREMGPVTPREWKMFALMSLVVLSFMLQPWTNIDPIYFTCFIVLACYVPGVNILERESIRDLNIIFLIFVTGCMSIGFVGEAVGANRWAISYVVPILEGWGHTLSVFGAYMAGVVLNFLLTPLAANAMFVPALGELGQALNVNPLPLFYAFNWGTDQYVLPYETVYFLYIFVTGRVALRHVVPALLVRMLLVGLLVVCIAVPYWKFIGLL